MIPLLQFKDIRIKISEPFGSDLIKYAFLTGLLVAFAINFRPKCMTLNDGYYGGVYIRVSVSG